MPANLKTLAVDTGLEKISFFSFHFHVSFHSQRNNAKECSSYNTVALISHASKVMLKILQARLQQYVNHEPPDVQAGFRKARGTRDQTDNIPRITEKARVPENIYFCFIDNQSL